MLATCCFCACHRNDFAISGVIADGNGETLYLEHSAISGVKILDSVKLKQSGEFSFFAARPDYPDLYQLRISNRRFIFCVDSTEKVSIKASKDSLAFPDEIVGSAKIDNLTRLRSSVRDLQREYASISTDSNFVFLNHLKQHRAFSDSLIMSDTKSIVSYFAIFQRVGQYYIYSPFEKSDRVYCAAVATAFKAYMPAYERTISLEAWVLDAMREEKRNANLLSIQDMVDNARSAVLDIVLPDKNGLDHRLSDLKGKVVLLDFSKSDMRNNAAYVLQLRELYNKYHSRGLEIYQVSVDDDIQTWIKSTENLPWTCVREDNRTSKSSLRTFNVNVLPTMFVVNRNGDVMSRHNDFKNLSNDINKCLTNR